MKCPKCDYLGFDTGDRCKNCGYDFGLLSPSAAPTPHDLTLHRTNEPAVDAGTWREPIDLALRDPLAGDAPGGVTPAATAPAAGRSPLVSARALPLFSPADDDAPLIKLPATPRPPLAVRRAADTPRFRATAMKPVRKVEPREDAPALSFVDEPPRTGHAPSTAVKTVEPANAPIASGSLRRFTAVLVDHAVLCAIDLGVVYFTLRIASLGMDDWRRLPFLPLAAFLGLLTFGYFTAFTWIGGQTIGKMASGIQVVAEARGGVLDVGAAVRRSLAGTTSFVTLGIAFLPALVGADRRALHDRLAHTRVIVKPVA